MCHVAGGRIRFEGRDLLSLTEAEMRALRGDRMAMIFQEPMTALNPLTTVGDQIDEMLRSACADEPQGAAREGARHARARPHSRSRLAPTTPIRTRLSGGQRQRVMIAMALALSTAAR